MSVVMDHPRDPIHVWQHCHACGAGPIVGRRYDCLVCPAGPDNHLCAACFESYQRGGVVHPSPESVPAHPTPRVHEFREADGLARSRYAPWLEVDDAVAAAPAVPNGLVVRPEFGWGSRSFIGSYAFVVASDLGDGRPLLLTALHVLDEAAKSARIDCSMKNDGYTGEELPRIIDRVYLYDVFAPKWMFADLGLAQRMLVLSDARIGDEEPYCQRDIAAFVASSSSTLSPGRLATRGPEVGEPLWIAANCGVAGRRTVATTVVERSSESLIFRFTAGADNPPRTSGAPLLNARGEVVGLNVGAGWFEGRRHGYGVHLDSIRRHLDAACSRAVA